MNNKQRIVLGIGAAVFLYALFTSPKISIVKGTYVIPPSEKKEIAKIVDVSTAMTRAVAILGAILLVSIALKDKKGRRIQSPMDRAHAASDCQEREKETPRQDIVGKIIRFLKDFF